MNAKKEPLYRKVNTTAHGVRHDFGGDFRDQRKIESPFGMKQGVRRGLDYTPLYRFLLAKVGMKWNDIHREAVSRLDREEPIYTLVALKREQAEDYVRVGESSYFSGLFVDEDGTLQRTNPELNETSLEPYCSCCTHTFNGKRFTRAYRG